jgi:hypothetical protein
LVPLLLLLLLKKDSDVTATGSKLPEAIACKEAQKQLW